MQNKYSTTNYKSTDYHHMYCLTNLKIAIISNKMFTFLQKSNTISNSWFNFSNLNILFYLKYFFENEEFMFRNLLLITQQHTVIDSIKLLFYHKTITNIAKYLYESDQKEKWNRE